MAMHGMVLDFTHVDYSDLTKFGTVKISRTKEGVVRIDVSGFEFKDAGSCRQNVAKAKAWARDVLAASVDATKLTPGGRIESVAV